MANKKKDPKRNNAGLTQRTRTSLALIKAELSMVEADFNKRAEVLRQRRREIMAAMEAVMKEKAAEKIRQKNAKTDLGD